MSTIGVFFGSRSPEHDVSIITGELIISELKKMGHSVVPVYIGQDGQWYIANVLGSLKFFTNPNFKENLTASGFEKYNLDMDTSHGKMVFRTKGWFAKTVIIDVAFPALHGAYGEDGTIQGFFEMLDVPYVGCGVAASAVAMNKVLTKDLYRANNIQTSPYLSLTSDEWNKDKAGVLTKIRTTLGSALFVKPARLGSSIGIGKVKDSASVELEFKIEVALHYDSLVIVENAVANVVDLTCAVLEKDGLVASVIQESVFDSDLFDFKEKYLTDGGAQLGNSKRGLVIPANIPCETTKIIQEVSKKVFVLLGANGILRVDWLYNRPTSELFANEVNTLPGTLYHHLWKASGLELRTVLESLLEAAQKKVEQRKALTHSYPSTLLQQAGSLKMPGSKLS